jgi:signal transduction histidine kinase
VEAQGGQIWIESATAAATGTTVVLVLPAAALEPTEQELYAAAAK